MNSSGTRDERLGGGTPEYVGDIRWYRLWSSAAETVIKTTSRAINLRKRTSAAWQIFPIILHLKKKKGKVLSAKTLWWPSFWDEMSIRTWRPWPIQASPVFVFVDCLFVFLLKQRRLGSGNIVCIIPANPASQWSKLRSQGRGLIKGHPVIGVMFTSHGATSQFGAAPSCEGGGQSDYGGVAGSHMLRNYSSRNGNTKLLLF